MRSLIAFGKDPVGRLFWTQVVCEPALFTAGRVTSDPETPASRASHWSERAAQTAVLRSIVQRCQLLNQLCSLQAE